MPRAMHWYESFIRVQKLPECPCSSRIAHPYTQHTSVLCNYRSESLQKLCVAYNNMFRKITFLPRDCSASLVFAKRDLPTCKMVIGKHVYIAMKSATVSRNVILHSIARSNCLFTSPLTMPQLHCSNSVTPRVPCGCIQISGTLFDEPPVRDLL